MENGAGFLPDWFAWLLQAVLAAPIVLILLSIELVYFWRRGVLRRHRIRVIVAMTATVVGCVLLFGGLLTLLPSSFDPTRRQSGLIGVLLVYLPQLVACALIAAPLCWWAAHPKARAAS